MSFTDSVKYYLIPENSVYLKIHVSQTRNGIFYRK